MKRYKVVVQHYYGQHYCIMYSNSYGIFWTTIDRVVESTLDNFDHGYVWSPILSKDQAQLVERAKNEFDTYEKLKAFRENEYPKANKFYQNYVERLSNIKGATRVV